MEQQLFRHEVWSILEESKPSRFKPPDLDVALQSICLRIGVQQDDDMRNVLISEIGQFVRFKRKNNSEHASNRTGCVNNNFVVFKRSEHEAIMEIDNNEKDEVVNTKTKSFLSLSKTGKHLRTAPLLDVIEKFMKEEQEIFERNKDTTVPMLTKSQLLGYLLQRINYKDDRKMSEIGTKILNGHKVGVSDFDVVDAITLMHDLVLSKEKVRTIRKYLMKKGIFFPSTTALLEARKKLRPVISPVLENKGVAVDYIELVSSTTSSVLDAVNDTQETSLDMSCEYTMYYKSGGDGAGSQTAWKSTSMNDAAENMFQYSLSPLKLLRTKDSDTEVIWKNPAPNSAYWVRPIMLIREKEDAVDLLNYVIPYTDQCRSFLNSGKINVSSWRTGEVHSVQHIIQDSMKDMKFKKKICGLGGADCILCESRQNDWLDEEQIKDGFDITRTAAENLDVYLELLACDNGSIIPKKGDYETRKGLTQKPLSSSDQKSICITHSYINCIGWWVKVLARMNAEYEQWVEKSNCYGDHIRNGHQRVVNKIKEETGLKLDQVCGSLSKGGGSTDGNQARRFFDEETLPTILSCVPPKYHDVVSHLHKNISVILRVISSNDRVHIDLFKALTLDTSLVIARQLKWVQINYTLHGTLHHSSELIAMNDSWSIGELSEEALEANNKYIRRYLELLSRKTSPVDQLTDVMARLLERSDPYIMTRKLKYRPNVSCCTCGSTKHSSKRHDKVSKLNNYGIIVNDILIDSL